MVNRWIENSLSLVVQNGCIFECLFYNVININDIYMYRISFRFAERCCQRGLPAFSPFTKSDREEPRMAPLTFLSLHTFLHNPQGICFILPTIILFATAKPAATRSAHRFVMVVPTLLGEFEPMRMLDAVALIVYKMRIGVVGKQYHLCLKQAPLMALSP